MSLDKQYLEKWPAKLKNSVNCKVKLQFCMGLQKDDVKYLTAKFDGYCPRVNGSSNHVCHPVNIGAEYLCHD